MLHARFRTHRLTIARTTRVLDGDGGAPATLTTVGTVEGSLQPAGAAEEVVADQQRTVARWALYLDPDDDVRRDDELTLTHVRNRSWVPVTTPPAFRALSVGRWWAVGAVDHAAVQLEEIQRGP